MQWIVITSSTLSAVCYLPDLCLLQVQFRSGECYTYFDVPTEVYAELLTAPSPGRYFNASIRNRFRFQLSGLASLASGAT